MDSVSNLNFHGMGPSRSCHMWIAKIDHHLDLKACFFNGIQSYSSWESFKYCPFCWIYKCSINHEHSNGRNLENL